jgi:serine/threonine protein kinase
MDPNSDTTTTGSSETRASETRFIGRYRVTRLLGSGGMGQVYLAHDPTLDREIAVKLIGGGIDDADARRRLVQEARAAGRLRHPNIVTIFDAGEHDGSPYIAMEHVGGETLRSLIRRRADLSLGRRLQLIEGACAGLAHAHRANVVHLDVKPDNLMLDGDGVLKVLDFGIARVLQNDALMTMHLAGTLRYMSPEQVSGRPLDRRSDVFSLGCSLFELVTYEPAYAGSPAALAIRIASGPVPRLAEALPAIDPRLDALVGRAMSLDPAKRFDDLDELGEALGRLRAELDSGLQPMRPAIAISTSAWRSGAAASSSRIASPGRALAAGIGAASIAAVALAVWMARPEQPATTASVAPPVTTESVGPAAGPAPLPSPSRGAPTTALQTPAPVGPRRDVTAAGAPAPGAPREDVWRRLARGDRAGVTELLRATEQQDPASRIAYEVLDAVRPAAQQARARAAGSPTQRGSAMFRSADEGLARANVLAQGGQPIEALAALWLATDLFASAASETGVAASVPPAQPVPLPEVARGVVPQPATADGARPAAETAVANSPPSDSDNVLAALRRYHQAYTARDVDAVRQMYPALGSDQVEQLRKSFEAVTAYEVDLRQPRVEVSGNSATVRALVARRIVPRVGRPVTSEAETEFALQRDARGWVIVAVTARP